MILYDCGLSPLTEQQKARIEFVIRQQRRQHAVKQGWIRESGEGLGTGPKTRARSGLVVQRKGI